LTAAFEQTGETPPKEALAVLLCAALGHDLLEDTSAKEKEVEDIAGRESVKLIEFLTNRLGDDHPLPYVTQVASAPEEARLIKLCDLTDNLFHGSFSIHTLGVPWMHSYFLPIVDPMREAVIKTEFIRYPKTGALLIATAQIARAHLKESIDRENTKA
jgi:hypothetical protein